MSSEIKLEGTVLGLDWGKKSVGVATADPQGLTTTPHEVFNRAPIKGDHFWVLENSDKLFLKSFIQNHECGSIVLGDPVALDGNRTEGSQGAQALKQELEIEFKLPVFLVNESLTSWEVKETKKKLPKSKREYFEKNTDSFVAARLIELFFES